MTETIFDIRQYIDDKRIYKSLKEHEINFSFQPAALIELYKKYTMLEKDISTNFIKNQTMQKTVLDTTVRLNKTDVTEEDTEGLQKLIDTMTKEYENQFKAAQEARALGLNMIMLAAQSNPGQEHITVDWLEKEIDAQEFGYIIRFIMKHENPEAVKKN